ncbi:MAG: 4-hydroxy-tetrahydrodipicolinate synthase [Nanohaloarchaea archaeon SW_7_43_1]|nr:MAG: 4-hydroxy-tetrahydrodipicolinate synthase [Nanohaloarchaea archaeon SW_7_43_1]
MTEEYDFEPEGVFPALPTPMNEEDEINYEASREHLEYLAENGIPGVVPAGCTGHAATLFHDEHIDYVTEVARMADDLGLDVIAGSGTNSTYETIDLAQRIEENADIDAHLMISPYQNKPAQRGNIQHYELVAEEVEEPIIAYNVPSRTGRNLVPETQERISEIPGVIGMKEASNMPDQIRELGERFRDREDFYLLSGDDPRNDLVYNVGGSGAISVTGNIAPERSMEVWETGLLEEDTDRAQELNEEFEPLHNAMFQDGEVNPVGVHYALNQMGFDFGTPRPPNNHQPLENERDVTGELHQNQTEIEEALKEFELN